MEVVRRSPAASIIRLEQKVELMATKEEFREEIKKLEERLGDKIVKQGERIGNLEGVIVGIKFTQKLLISLYLSILGIVAAIFVKMFFFQ